jgi:predicted glycoside hydrolase/deacetylase ChbG (UPF0249 family)
VAKRLIVNADDLGRTRGINRGILEAHRDGLVTSATLMVNYATAREAVRLCREAPGLGLGLHVALTGGVPCLPPDRVASLVDPRGQLPPKPEGLAGSDPDELQAEVRAQLERFRELTGRLPTHLDSHHHAHRLPPVLEALLTVAREHGLPIRGDSVQTRERLARDGVPTTDHFVESFFDSGATLEALTRVLRELPSGTTELMCHPAVVDDELRETSSYAEARARELAVLTHETVRRTCGEAGVELIHFGAL